MKFNKIISAFLLPVLALFSSCEQNLDEPVRISTEKAAYEVGKEGGDVVVKLLATQDWKATVSPASSLDDVEGITVEPSEGKASSDAVDVTLKVAANKGYNRAAIISFTGATVSGAITLSQEGEEGERLLTCTVDEFLALPVDASVYYVLEGEVTNSTTPSTYSNFSLLDPETGSSVYIYGLAYKDDPTNQKVGLFEKEGIEEGDWIKIASTRGEYNGTIEGINSYYISHKKSETPFIKLGSTEVTAAKGTTFSLAVSSNLVTWTLSSNVDWLTFEPATSDKSETVTVTVGSEGEGNEGTITLSAEGLESVTCKVTRTDIIDATVAEFLAAEVGDTQYRLTGKIESIANEKYGNLYIQDATGRVYVYGIDGWADLGLRQGDIITIVGVRARYDGAKVEDQKEEMKNAVLEFSAKSTDVTIAEFLAKESSSTYLTSPYYRLSGVVKEIVKAEYGNFYLKAEDSEDYVYVYGLTKAPVAKNDKSFGDLGIAEGYKVTIVGQRGSYAGAKVEDQKEEVLNAYIVTFEEGAPANVLKVNPITTSLIAEDTECTIDVTCTGDWTVTKDEGDWITSFTEGGTGDGTIKIEFPANTTTETLKAKFTVTSGELTASFTVDQKGIVETVYANIAELNEAILAAGETGMDFKLELTSPAEVTKIGSDTKTSFIQDATGAVMIYGAPLTTYIENAAEKTTIKGVVTGTAVIFKGLPEITFLNASEATIAQDGTGIYTEATIAELLANFDKYLNCKVKLADATVKEAFSKTDRNGTLAQGENVIALFVKNNTVDFSYTAGTVVDAYVFPAYNNETKQVCFWGIEDFTVKAIGTEISLKSAFSVNAGETVALGATATSTGTLKYASSNEAVATVSAEGVVTGVAEGTAEITVSVDAVEGYTAATATTTITVNPAGTVITTQYFVKVTSTPTDWSGKYLIVYETGNVAFDGSLTNLDSTPNTVEVKVDAGQIEATTELLEKYFTIESTTADGATTYALKAVSGKYIGRTQNKNGLESSDEALAHSSLTVDDSGNFIVKTSAGPSLQYNATSGQDKFRYFKSTTQQPVQLYKLAE